MSSINGNEVGGIAATRENNLFLVSYITVQFRRSCVKCPLFGGAPEVPQIMDIDLVNRLKLFIKEQEGEPKTISNALET